MLAAHIGEIQPIQAAGAESRASEPSRCLARENFKVAWKREMSTSAASPEGGRRARVEAASDRAVQAGDGSQQPGLRSKVDEETLGRSGTGRAAKVAGDDTAQDEPVATEAKTAAQAEALVSAPATKLEVAAAAAAENPRAERGQARSSRSPVETEKTAEAAKAAGEKAVTAGKERKRPCVADGTQIEDVDAGLAQTAQDQAASVAAATQVVAPQMLVPATLNGIDRPAGTAGAGAAQAATLGLKRGRRVGGEEIDSSMPLAKDIEHVSEEGLATSAPKEAKPVTMPLGESPSGKGESGKSEAGKSGSGTSQLAQGLVGRASGLLSNVAAPASGSELVNVTAAGANLGHTAPAASAGAALPAGGLNAGSTADFGGVQGHQLLAAGPKQLEIGLMDGTHGWLKIRAEFGADGAVSASLTGNATAHESLRQALPEIASYLEAEAVGVSRIAVHRAAESSPTTGLTREGDGQGGHGQQGRGSGQGTGEDTGVRRSETAEGAGYGMSSESGATLSSTSSTYSTSSTSSTGDAAGSLDWITGVSPMMFGRGTAFAMGGGGSGSWLSVRA